MTNIWKFSDGVEDVDAEEAVEDEREGRMMGLVIEEWVWICGDVVALADRLLETISVTLLWMAGCVNADSDGFTRLSMNLVDVEEGR